MSKQKFLRRVRDAGVAAAIGIGATSILPIGPLESVANAAGTIHCGDLAQYTSTFTGSFGTRLARHESKATVCWDDTNVTGMAARRNEVVNIGIGQAWGSSEWRNTGPTPARSTWDEHHGTYNVSIEIWGVGFNYDEQHTFGYGFTKSSNGSWVNATVSNSGWY